MKTHWKILVIDAMRTLMRRERRAPDLKKVIGLIGLIGLGASAQMINVHVSTENLVGTILTNESVSLTPGWSGGRVFGGNEIPNRTVTQKTDATGQTTFSNVLFGPYGLNLYDTSFGLQVPTNLSGTIDAGELITNPAVVLPSLNEYVPPLPSWFVSTNGQSASGEFVESSSTWPGWQWVYVAPGGGGLSTLYGTNGGPVGNNASMGWVPTNYDAAGAASASTNPISSWITAATNPIPVWISTAAQNSTNPIPQWISSSLAAEVLTNDTRALTLSNAANGIWGFFAGNGANLNSLNASAMASGTAPVARLPMATSNTEGIVQPDNSTITITNGVISASASGGGQTLTPFYWIVGIAAISSGSGNIFYPVGLQSQYFGSGISRCEISVPQNWGSGPIIFTNISFGLNCASGVQLGPGTNSFLYYATNAPGAASGVVAGGGWAAEIIGGSAQQYVTNNPTFNFPLSTNVLFYGFLSNSPGSSANVETWGAYNILHN